MVVHRRPGLLRLPAPARSRRVRWVMFRTDPPADGSTPKADLRGPWMAGHDLTCARIPSKHWPKRRSRSAYAAAVFAHRLPASALRPSPQPPPTTQEAGISGAIQTDGAEADESRHACDPHRE